MSECFFLFWVKIELFRQEVYAQKSLCSHKHSIRTRNINHIRLLKLVNKEKLQKLINFLTKKHISNDRDPQKKNDEDEKCVDVFLSLSTMMMITNQPNNNEHKQPTLNIKWITSDDGFHSFHSWMCYVIDFCCIPKYLLSSSLLLLFDMNDKTRRRQDMKPEIMMMIIINIMDVYY